MRIACLLRDLRQARELSLRDVERMTGIASTDRSKVERGRMLPRDDWLAAMEQAYGANRSSWYVPPEGAIAGVVIESDAMVCPKSAPSSCAVPLTNPRTVTPSVGEVDKPVEPESFVNPS